MTLPQRKWLNHETPAGVRDAAFFITICCQERGRNQLCNSDVAGKLLNAARHYHGQGRWHLWLWLLMPDYSHGLVETPGEWPYAIGVICSNGSGRLGEASLPERGAREFG